MPSEKVFPIISNFDELMSYNLFGDLTLGLSVLNRSSYRMPSISSATGKAHGFKVYVVQSLELQIPNSYMTYLNRFEY